MKRSHADSAQVGRMPLEDMLVGLDAERFAVLATSDHGKPYTSLIAFALTSDRRMLVFSTPRDTRKYENIRSQPAVSILLDDRWRGGEDPRMAQAITLLGTAKEVKAAARKAQCRAVLISRHPELASFVDEPGTALITVSIKQAIHVTQLQTVSSWP
jgi:nitroimidazol reductase NimA-like FMN-containing flavoprotein (pyridoxamine 5'-phosphate oxidase superfamily)